jgi:hypothetical protein
MEPLFWKTYAVAWLLLFSSTVLTGAFLGVWSSLFWGTDFLLGAIFSASVLGYAFAIRIGPLMLWKIVGFLAALAFFVHLGDLASLGWNEPSKLFEFDDLGVQEDGLHLNPLIEFCFVLPGYLASYRYGFSSQEVPRKSAATEKG